MEPSQETHNLLSKEVYPGQLLYQIAYLDYRNRHHNKADDGTQPKQSSHVGDTPHVTQQIGNSKS